MINKDRKWYKWPQGYLENKSFVPLYQMVRRLITYPTLLLGFSICYLSILLGYGFRDAEDFRRML